MRLSPSILARATLAATLLALAAIGGACAWRLWQAADGDQHMVADARRHRHRRTLDGSHAGGAAHRHEQRELEVRQAEIGNEVLGDAAAREIGHDAVDVARAEARVCDGG